ncbi:MAG: NUDIX hydrolase [Elainellaceae cyanobacterium]
MPLAADARPRVVGAILRQNDQFLMQLRDDIPTIAYPGHWAFFGGHIEPGETPEASMRRELLEEIGYCPSMLTEIGCYDNLNVIRYVFYGLLDISIDRLVLGEGWDLDLFTSEHIHQGYRFSNRAKKICPIGLPHQQILLDFLQQSDGV